MNCSSTLKATTNCSRYWPPWGTAPTSWPGLVDRSDYTFCNQLGAEAVQSGLAGLVTPSARHDGANLPVFRRDAVSDPELLDVAAVTFDPNTGETTVRR